MKILLIFFLFSTTTFASEELALKKIAEFEKALKTELKKGLSKSPQEAVKVCNLKAPQIQKKVSTKDLQIGRVSLKNRNPQNTLKEWMIKSMDSYHQDKNKKPYVVVDLGPGKKGLLKPIRTIPLCLKCHGGKIEPSLKSEIQKLYPEDKAFGYKVGDIRGFFWAEYEDAL